MTSVASPRRPSEPDAPSDPRVARSRARLREAALELLVESGPRAVTVDAVVERSGVARSTLYRHWASHSELLVEVLRCNVPEVHPPDAALTFADALRSLLHDLADTLASPEWRAIMPALIALQHHMPEVAQLSDAERDDKLQILAEVLDRGVREGALPAAIDVELAAHVLIGPIVFGVVSGQVDRLIDVVDYVVDRFLASY